MRYFKIYQDAILQNTSKKPPKEPTRYKKSRQPERVRLDPKASHIVRTAGQEHVCGGAEYEQRAPGTNGGLKDRCIINIRRPC
jgi:hypothetical protein